MSTASLPRSPTLPSVAASPRASAMVTPHLEPGSWPPLVQFNADQYHEMIRAGILPEAAGIELIEGLIVRTDRSARGESIMSIGKEHEVCISLLTDLLFQLREMGCHLRIQQSISVNEKNLPEPDVLIARGAPRDYVAAKPTGRDAICLIEVADRSLAFDRTHKLRLYATAGVAQYMIVDLHEKRLEIYRSPNPTTGTYSAPEYASGEQTVRIYLDADRYFDLTAASVLP